MRRSRGLALGSAILVAAIIAMLGFALSSAGLAHLNLGLRANNGAQAENLAQSVVAQALDSLFKDDEYGKNRGEAPFRITIQGPNPGSEGLLTFDKTAAEDLNIPYSTNNLEGSSPQIGPEGQSIPVDKIHLVGVGRSGGVERRLDVILHVPPYPYAVSSEGPIHALQGAKVATLREAPEFGVPNLVDALPADMFSNGSARDAVRLGNETEVTGDVISVGGIRLESDNVTVQGQIRPNESRRDLPSFNLGRYDPAEIGIHESLDQGSYSGRSVFEGLVRRQGDIVFNGDVKMNNGLIFVDGDVDIRGGLEGEGLLVATGKVTVDGGARLASDSKLALLAGGDVVLRGSGNTGSYFQGTVYTKGGLMAEDLTVVGTLIAAGRNDSVTLDNTRVLRDPNSGKKVEFEIANESADGESASSFQVVTQNGVYVVDIQQDASGEVSGEVWPEGSPRRAPFTLTRGSSPQRQSEEIYEALRRASLGGALQFKSEFVRGCSTRLAYSLDILSQQTSGEPSGSSVIVVDPSEFLTLQDKARVLLWQKS